MGEVAGAAAAALLLLVPTPRCGLARREDFDLLSLVSAHTFLDPQAAVERGRSDMFADDLVGRVDVTTSFEGAELNTEYLLGLFANVRHSNTTSIIGYPAAQEAQTLIVEPPLVHYSGILWLGYDTVDKRIPVQIDLTTAWNDDLKMISYDATFRRFPQAFNLIIDTIASQVAKELNETYDPATADKHALMSRKAASEICPIAMEYCVGENQQYESYDQCYNFITEERKWGEPWEGGLDTNWCRYVHLNMVQFRPDVHCSHVGPSGGDMCINRDYMEVTTAFPFKQTFIAPNTTWNDRDMRGLSDKSIKELGKAKLTLVIPTTIPFFSVPTFVFFILLYLSAKATERGLARYSKDYRRLSPANQRNTVTYVLNTVYTTVALILQLIAAPVLAHSYTQLGFQSITLTAAIISALYVFEVIYRDFMRPSLLAHHFCTLLAIISLFVTIEKTFHPEIVTVGAIWLFQATTEQSVFIGLLMYRLGCSARNTRWMLRFAAVQSFLCKFAFAIYLIVEHSLRLVQFHSDPRDVYFSIIVYLVGSLLLATQVYGSWAVWAISLKLDKAVYCEEGRPTHPAARNNASEGSTIPPSPALSTAPTLVDWPVQFNDGDDEDGVPKKHLRVPSSPA
ncbi:hypothetical protein JCM10450v2_000291 [Rhodotorula kratochvilovae]